MKRPVLTVTTDPDLFARIVSIQKATKRSRASVVEELLAAGLKKSRNLASVGRSHATSYNKVGAA